MADAPRCAGRKTNGEPCKGWRQPGSDKCRRHLPNPKARANAAVRAEVMRWGLQDQHDDPGEVLLRLVTQSRVRVEHYASLVQEAYEAAERLAAGYAPGQLLASLNTDVESWTDDDDRVHYENPQVQAAKLDLERIFATGGVSALVGGAYSNTPSGEIYATGEAIRALVDLERGERKFCADLCVKAVAAGLAERQVRLAEKQGAMIADVLRAVLGDAELGLSAEQRKAAPAAIRRHLASVAS